MDGRRPLELKELQERYESIMHVLGQSIVELEGASAKSETYFVAYHRGVTDGTPRLDTAAGRYVDRLEKREGEWRIANRTVVLEWVDSNPDLKMDTWPLDRFTRGQRDRTDAAYG